MGLDMYLLSKRQNNEMKGGTTGACSGLIPLTIAAENDEVEIGYWRKDYELAGELCEMLFSNGENDNCVKKALTKEQINKVIKSTEKRLNKLRKKCFITEYEDYQMDDYRHTIEIFNNALAEIDKGATILYEQWY